MKPKMIILEPEDLVEFALLGLLLGTHHPCLLPYLALLEWDVCLSYVPPLYFRKHTTCAVSQVHIWRGSLRITQLEAHHT